MIVRLVLLFALLVTVTSCKKPESPVLTPKKATISGLGLQGFRLDVELDVYNPNGFSLSVQQVAGHVVLGGQHDLGTVTVTKPFELAEKSHTAVTAPLTMAWPNATLLAALAVAAQPVPYTLDGQVVIGGEKLNVTLPFQLKGTIAREDIVAATKNSLPALPPIPGLDQLLP